MLTGFNPMISREEIERIKQLRDSGAPAPRPADPPEPAAPAYRERINGREQTGLYALGGTNELLENDVKNNLRERLKKLGLWWRFNGLIKQLQGIQQAVQDSAEPEQIRTIQLRSRHIRVYIGMDKISDPEGAYVRIPDLNTVVGAVLQDTCGLCVKDQAEAHKCPLRLALRAMTTVSEREVSPARNGCIYKSMTVSEEWEL